LKLVAFGVLNSEIFANSYFGSISYPQEYPEKLFSAEKNLKI